MSGSEPFLFDVRHLARVPLRGAEVTAYRHVAVPSRGRADALNTAGDGRWHETAWRHPVLYCAEDAETAIAEYCRARADRIAAADPTGGLGLNRLAYPAYAELPVGEPLPARLLYRIELRLERVADLTHAGAELRRAGFDPAWLTADDHTPCRSLALLGLHLGWQAIRTASAALPDADNCCLPVFPQSLGAKPRTRSLAIVRPTVAIAVRTTYRKNERPAWLPPPA